MGYIPLLLVKGPQENCLKSSFIWCQIFQLQTIEKYNRYSTFIIYYNKLSKSSRLKLIGRHCVLADFLPNTLTKKIYIYIYVYIYISYDICTVVVCFLAKFILRALELGKKWDLGCFRNMLSAMAYWYVFYL